MLGFLAIFSAGLCGYAQAAAVSWPCAAIALISVTWAQNYMLVRRGFESGLEDITGEVLMRSLFNAVVATGGSYWVGVLVRAMSDL